MHQGLLGCTAIIGCNFPGPHLGCHLRLGHGAEVCLRRHVGPMKSSGAAHQPAVLGANSLIFFQPLQECPQWIRSAREGKGTTLLEAQLFRTGTFTTPGSSRRLLKGNGSIKDALSGAAFPSNQLVGPVEDHPSIHINKYPLCCIMYRPNTTDIMPPDTSR
jgi:hypothetical protein